MKETTRNTREQLKFLRTGINTYQDNINTLTRETRNLERFYRDLQQEHQGTFSQCENQLMRGSSVHHPATAGGSWSSKDHDSASSRFGHHVRFRESCSDSLAASNRLGRSGLGGRVTSNLSSQYTRGIGGRGGIVESLTMPSRKPESGVSGFSSRKVSKVEIPVWVEEKYRSIQQQFPPDPRRRKEVWRDLNSKPEEESWQRSVRRSGRLFAPDSCRLAVLESISMAWTQDKFRHVQSDNRV